MLSLFWAIPGFKYTAFILPLRCRTFDYYAYRPSVKYNFTETLQQTVEFLFLLLYLLEIMSHVLGLNMDNTVLRIAYWAEETWEDRR